MFIVFLTNTEKIEPVYIRIFLTDSLFSSGKRFIYSGINSVLRSPLFLLTSSLHCSYFVMGRYIHVTYMLHTYYIDVTYLYKICNIYVTSM